MSKPSLPNASFSKKIRRSDNYKGLVNPIKSSKNKVENSDVLVSAVISSYLLTHLHHVLQRAEYGAIKEGKVSLASNFAQLRKVLCMDARSMQDASATGYGETNHEKFHDSNIQSKVA